MLFKWEAGNHAIGKLSIGLCSAEPEPFRCHWTWQCVLQSEQMSLSVVNIGVSVYNDQVKHSVCYHSINKLKRTGSNNNSVISQQYGVGLWTGLWQLIVCKNVNLDPALVPKICQFVECGILYFICLDCLEIVCFKGIEFQCWTKNTYMTLRKLDVDIKWHHTETNLTKSWLSREHI